MKTLVVIPHFGPDQLVCDLLASAGFHLPAGRLPGEQSLIELPSYSFLIINNNGRNRGFTAACNIGLQHLTESPAYDSAWLLNNDTEFESRTQFEQSLAAMRALGAARCWGIVSQQIRRFDNRDAIIFGGSLECFPAGRHRSGSVSKGDWEHASEERWLSFCSVLILRSVVEKIGLMDQQLVNYFSDSDYSLRARAAGIGIGYAGRQSFVYHKVGQSSNPGAEQTKVLRGDCLSFWQKWLSGDLHAAYLALMGSQDPAAVPAGSLRAEADSFPELSRWLATLDHTQELGLGDIVQHFAHLKSATPFSVLCNITAELLETVY